MRIVFSTGIISSREYWKKFPTSDNDSFGSVLLVFREQKVSIRIFCITEGFMSPSQVFFLKFRFFLCFSRLKKHWSELGEKTLLMLANAANCLCKKNRRKSYVRYFSLFHRRKKNFTFMQLQAAFISSVGRKLNPKGWKGALDAGR